MTWTGTCRRSTPRPAERRSATPEGTLSGPSARTIFFLSDFGTEDEFVGVVHAVLRRWAPSVPVVDLTHHVPPFDVGAGAATLARCAPYLGPGVVVAVVDPGVGTDRRAVAVSVAVPDGPAWLVGPDNGLLVPAAEQLGGVTGVLALRAGDLPPHLRPGRRGGPVGPTFDGRDLFAPVAAHLAAGGDPAAVGRPADPASLVRLPTRPEDTGRWGADADRSKAEAGPGEAGTGRRGAHADQRGARADQGTTDQGKAGIGQGKAPLPGGWLTTAVQSVDRFGNVELRAPGSVLDRWGIGVGRSLLVATGAAPDDPRPARRVVAFGDLGPGELGILVDASGFTALVLDRARADDRLGPLAPGGTVRLHPADQDDDLPRGPV